MYAGDEFDEYVPPFSFKLNAAGDGVVEDGTPLHAILFLVYKQPGRWIVRPDNYVKTTRRAVCYALTKKKCIFRIDFQGGQWGCEPKLGMRVTNKVDNLVDNSYSEIALRLDTSTIPFLKCVLNCLT